MRTIKFRAWDKDYKVMHFKLEESHKLPLPQPLHTYLENTERFDIMQFTGLHDKNGKEIYEGDVVEFGTSKLVVEYKENRRVESGHGDCSETLFIGFNIGSSYGKDNKPKVIGNVYENPELVNN